MPRVIGGGSATARINARLGELDAEAKTFAADCNTDPPNSFFERAVSLPFQGPGFLTVLESVGFYCPGAAHPSGWTFALTFDLATGREVEVSSLVPPRFREKDDDPLPADTLRATPSLVDLYLVQAETLPEDCRAAVARAAMFQLWPDAGQRGLVLMPTSLAHAEQACADPVTLTQEVLRREGFDPALIRALEATGPDSPG